MAGAVLSFTGVSVGYQGPPVLTDVDLHLADGQRLALVGPNGAGKSTLIKTILGLTSLRSGTTEVYGRSPAKARDLCGYVPQGDALDAGFPVSAAQVVMMGRYRRIGWWRPARAADRHAVREALDRVGLADQAGRRFGLLSGGQRQRVLLARALAAEPRMLLLDEPFNGVDAVSKEAILAVLRASSATVVLSTHDLTLARDFADVVALVNGRLWECGPPAATLTAEHLRRAYGGHAVDLADGRTVLVEP
jgi:manganese/iron transport system ATP-binding protein